MLLNVRAPFEAQFFGGQGQSETAGRQVSRSPGVDGVIDGAIAERAPAASDEGFHFPVDNFDGDGALINGTGKVALSGEGIGEREEDTAEDGHRDEQFDQEGAGGTATGSAKYA